MQFEFASRRSV